MNERDPFVLAIAGSPRRQANTDIMLENFLCPIRDAGIAVELLIIEKLDVTSCLACGGCDRTGRCVVKDDMQAVYPLLESASGIVIASPVHFMSIPGKLKSVIDRCQCLWVKRFILSSPERRDDRSLPGAFLSVGGCSLSHLFDGSTRVIRSVLACLGTRLVSTVTEKKIDKPGNVQNHPNLLEQCRNSGARMLEEINKNRTSYK